MNICHGYKCRKFAQIDRSKEEQKFDIFYT